MSASTITVICYYNGQLLRTEIDVKYEGRKARIEPLDVPVECTFEQLTDLIYTSTTIDKQRFKLVLNCKYPLKSGNRFQHFSIWNDSSVCRMLNLVNTTTIEDIELYVEVVRVKALANQSVGGHVDLLVRDNYNVQEFDYGCGPNRGPIPETRVFRVDEGRAYEEGNDEDVDDDCNGDADVEADGHASSFRTFNQILENEKGIYVSAQAPSCDISNQPDNETLDESSPVHYHLPPTPHFDVPKPGVRGCRVTRHYSRKSGRVSFVLEALPKVQLVPIINNDHTWSICE